MARVRGSWSSSLASGFVFLLGCSGPLPVKYVETSTGGGGNVTSGTGGTSKGGSSSTSDSGIPDFGPLGAACSSDNDCTEGLICLGASGHTLGDYGPPSGFCTEGCHKDADCASFDGASCVQLLPDDASTSYCAPPCTLGDDVACGNRADVACWPLSLFGGATGRACVPTCNSDEQCPSGTTCDAAFSLCSKTAQGGGQALGTSCDPQQSLDTCNSGFCLELDDGSGVCSAYCRRGTFPQCGGDEQTSLCAWVPDGDQAAGAADIGFCALRCRCDADCNDPGLRCEARSDLTGAYPGICSASAGPADTDCSLQ